MERRKIVYQDGSYQLLKPRDDGTNRFHNYGKRKSLKAIVYLIDNGNFDIDISKVKRDIDEYRIRISHKNLSKVI